MQFALLAFSCSEQVCRRQAGRDRRSRCGASGPSRSGCGGALRRGGAVAAACGPGDLQARNETLQVTLLLGVEIARLHCSPLLVCLRIAPMATLTGANVTVWSVCCKSSKDRAKADQDWFCGKFRFPRGDPRNRGRGASIKVENGAAGGRPGLEDIARPRRRPASRTVRPDVHGATDAAATPGAFERSRARPPRARKSSAGPRVAPA